MGTMVLKPKATHLCVLTKIAGQFAGLGESVHLTTDNTNWILEGQSQQGGVSASAMCFQRDAFTAAVNGSVNVVRTEFQASINDYSDTGRCFFGAKQETAAGNAFTFLEGFSGRLSLGVEDAYVNQSASLDSTSWFAVAACRPSMAWARAFRVGDAVHPALFMAPHGTVGDAVDIPEYRASNNGTVEMAPYDKAFCGFTAFGGQFNGGGESVRIYAATGPDNVRRWMLAASSASGSGTFASARCFARDQQ